MDLRQAGRVESVAAKDGGRGLSFRKELKVVHGTRKGLMMRLRAIFEKADPDAWMKRWLTHQRHLVYATFPSSELCISTDFSAQYVQPQGSR